MKKINEIIKDKGGRYCLVFDEEQLIVDRSTLIEKQLYKGKMLSEQTVSDIKRRQIECDCYRQALKLLTMRDHFCSELANKLRQRQYQQAVICRVVDRLKGECYLDEYSLAERIVENKILNDSRMRVYQYLLKRGCPQAIAHSALEVYRDNEVVKAYRALTKRAALLRDADDPAQRNKLLAALARRGFSYRDAKSAYQMYLADNKRDI